VKLSLFLQVPSFFDQHDMAVRIHERELGVRIKNPLFCTKQDVLAALYEILEPRKFDTVSKNIKKVRSLLRNAVGNDFAGGAKVNDLPT
jgi:UDP:flavonoid glycosyltransferase YjiC (YdhE family)